MPRDSLVGSSRRCWRARKFTFRALPQNYIGSIDPHALKIPARRAEFTQLTENALFPFQAEPGHGRLGGYLMMLTRNTSGAD